MSSLVESRSPSHVGGPREAPGPVCHAEESLWANPLHLCFSGRWWSGEKSAKNGSSLHPEFCRNKRSKSQLKIFSDQCFCSSFFQRFSSAAFENKIDLEVWSAKLNRHYFWHSGSKYPFIYSCIHQDNCQYQSKLRPVNTCDTIVG